MTASLHPGDTGALIPEVGRLRMAKLPRVEERTLDNGLTVLAARRPTVPLVEIRLRIPTARGRRAGDGAVERLTGETILAGTSGRDAVVIASELQGLGATLGVSVGLEQIVVSGSVLSANIGPYLDLLADVLVRASYPADEVEVSRGRVIQELSIARSQPGTLAAEAVAARLYGAHPYGRPLPPPEAVAGLTPAAVRRFHRERVVPAGSVLLVVGDVRPTKLFGLAEAALGPWASGTSASSPVPAPPRPTPAPILVINRPGAVQTSIRLAGPATSRTDDDHAAFTVAHTVFGGGFSSRLNRNLREDKGFTYGAACGVDHRLSASHVVVQADVASAVTGPALVEIQYELARMVSTPVTTTELTAAQRFRNGQLALTIQSQVGFASQLAALVPHGLGVEYLKALPAAVDRVTDDDVLRVARAYLAPASLLTVLVGDADAIVPQVEALAPVEVVGE